MEKGRLFSLRPKLFKDELLSSFLMRLASKNGLDFLRLINNFNISSSHYLQKSDIDLIDFAPLGLLDIDGLIEKCNLEKEVLLNGSFLRVIKKFHQQNYSNARNFSDVLRKKLYYCPSCLSDNTYNKMMWKISGIDVCLEHKTSLLNKCWKCNQDIFYSQLSMVGLCPHCDIDLKKGTKIYGEVGNTNKNLVESWEFLLSNRVDPIENHELAKRLLFLLNRQKNELDRELVEENLNGHITVPTLLQHVRRTITHQKNLHIDTVLNILSDNNTNLEEIFKNELTECFEESLNNKSKTEGVTCIAPWCSSFQVEGSLLKTGTSKKERLDGTKLKYYLFCNECGCEYAFNYDHQLIERSYFISSYQKLINYFNTSGFSLKSLSSELDLSIEKTRRVLSYFISKLDLRFNKTYAIDTNKLGYFINAIKANKKIKEIRKWNQWGDYNEFLIYRYHIDVINQIYKKEHKKNITVKNNPNFLLVKKAVDELLESNDDITIKNVCALLNVCSETIRNWEGNGYIAEMKKQQREIRINQMEEEIKRKLEVYFEETPPEDVTSGHLYNYLGIGRTVLWRINKDLTRLISYRLGTLKYEESV